MEGIQVCKKAGKFFQGVRPDKEDVIDIPIVRMVGLFSVC